MTTANGIESITAPTPTAVDGAHGRATSTPDAEQLKALAAEFEAMLMGQMLRQMQSSMFGDDDDSSAGFAKGPLADAMFSELSLALSRAGGMGLTESMLGPLLQQAQALGVTGESVNGIAMPGAELSMLPVTGAPLPVATTPAAAGAWSSPVSSGFGWRSDPFSGASKFHKGMDIAMPIGQDVPAADAGRVTFAGTQGSYGLTVVVEHRPGLVSRYAHLSELAVAEGDEVAAGQTLAKSGASGRATGPHLHFEVLEDGQPVDPADRLARLGMTLGE